MKNLILSRNFTLAVCTVFAMMFIFSSCSKENVNDVTKEEAQEEVKINEENWPSKEIQLFDATKENNVTIKVSTEDESLLELYTDETFVAEFIEKSQFESRNPEIERPESGSEIVDEPQLDDDASENAVVHIEVIDQNVKENLTFSLKYNEDSKVDLRYYWYTTWFKVPIGYWWGIRITAYDYTGVYAAGYDATSSSCAYIYSSPYLSDYLTYYGDYQNYWRLSDRCLYVKVIHSYNYGYTWLN